MKTPKIKTYNGSEIPVTDVPDSELIDAYIENCDDPNDRSLVRLLRYARMDTTDAGVVLRRLLASNKNLIAVYPMAGSVVPEGAERLGSIPDGSLYAI